MSQQVKAISKSQLIKRSKSYRTKPAFIVARILTIFLLVLICFLQTFPFYLKVVTSLHGMNFIMEPNTMYLLPQEFSPFNYITALKRGDFLTGLGNSVIHTFTFVLASLVVAFIFGYVLGKHKFKGKNIIFILILSTMMVPGEVLMIPNFLLVQKLGWYDNLAGIILPGLVNIFGIYLFKQFMNTIPDAMLESADLDGAGELTKIFRIVMPMCIPVIVTYIILTFTATWNEYLWPSIILQDSSKFTLQLTMLKFYPMYPGFGDEFIRAAGMILISLPIILLFLTQQRYFMQSVNVSGMK